MNFMDVLIEKVSRENPLHLAIANPDLYSTGDAVLSLQDVIKIIRILDHWKCNNDLTICADLGLPMHVEFNGHLVQQELGGARVRSQQLMAMREIAGLYEVSAWLENGSSTYEVGAGLNIIRIYPRGSHR